jgi:hypothetical protein
MAALVLSAALVVAVPVALAAEPAAAAEASGLPDVAGTWALTVETSAGTGTPTVVLEQDGARLTGTYHGRFGDQPLTGSLEGAAIRFSFTVSGPMGSADVTYAGTVAGEEMSGTMHMGERAGGRFTARRQQAAP